VGQGASTTVCGVCTVNGNLSKTSLEVGHLHRQNKKVINMKINLLSSPKQAVMHADFNGFV
jgi:hypothetical protein